MAHLWIQDPSEGWTPQPLDGRQTFIVSRAGTLELCEAFDGEGQVQAELVRVPASNGGGWLIGAARTADLRVNGRRLHGGLRVLLDRDEIRLKASTFFFSTETPPAIEQFADTSRKFLCARCRQPIAPDMPAVKCPQCGIWHHQSESLPCWTYAERCTRCDQATELSAAYRWTPTDI